MQCRLIAAIGWTLALICVKRYGACSARGGEITVPDLIQDKGSSSAVQ